MKAKPRRNRNRRDPSQPQLPPIGIIAVDLDTGNAVITCDIPLVINGQPLSGISVIHAGVTHDADVATAVDNFNVNINFGTYAAVAGDVLVINSQMTGIRTARGGTLAVGQYTFPA